MRDIVDEEAARIAGFAETPIIDAVPDSAPGESARKGPEASWPEEIAAAETPEARNTETAAPEAPAFAENRAWARKPDPPE